MKKAVSRQTTKIAAKIKRGKNKAFREFIQEFKTHPVTMELAAGPHASNTSGTLDGYGNLFSFIGFEAGENPTQIIEDYILNKLRQSMVIVPNARQGGWRVVVAIPSLEDIAMFTPMPWAQGRSWVVGIHAGISGLGQYMYSSRGSRYNTRSGTAFQVDANIRGGGFQNVPYMVPLLKSLEKKVRDQIRMAVKV
jgi:hypothetical protein